MRVWYSQPLLNMVYEAIKILSKGGEAPVRDTELIAYLKNNGVEISRIDLAYILLKLETIGYIRTLSSGEEIDIRLLK